MADLIDQFVHSELAEVINAVRKVIGNCGDANNQRLYQITSDQAESCEDANAEIERSHVADQVLVVEAVDGDPCEPAPWKGEVVAAR